MARPTRHSYRDGPGSFARLLEAALAAADVDASPACDQAYHGACCRLRAAAMAYAAQRGMTWPPRETAPEEQPAEAVDVCRG